MSSSVSFDLGRTRQKVSLMSLHPSHQRWSFLLFLISFFLSRNIMAVVLLPSGQAHHLLNELLTTTSIIFAPPFTLSVICASVHLTCLTSWPECYPISPYSLFPLLETFAISLSYFSLLQSEILEGCSAGCFTLLQSYSSAFSSLHWEMLRSPFASFSEARRFSSNLHCSLFSFKALVCWIWSGKGRGDRGEDASLWNLN